MLASACSPRPARLGLLASAFALGIVSLLSLLLNSTAQGYPGGGNPGGGGYPSGPPPPPSHYWKITYTQTGAWSYTYFDASTGSRTPQNGNWATLTDPNNTSPNNNGGGDTHGYRPILSCITDGTVTATLTWIPATGQTIATDTPPKTVYITEYAHASWAGAWDTNGSAPPPDADYTGVLADDGLGDPAVYGLSAGTHLITRDGSSGTIVLTCSLHAHNPQSQYVLYPGTSYSHWTWSGGGLAWTYFNVQTPLDNRKVIITSPIETSYYKYLGVSQNGTTNKWDHQRDPFTGAMIVDSAVAWRGGLDDPRFAPGWQVNDLPLTAVTSNFLTSYFFCSWSLQGFPHEGYFVSTTGNPAQFSLLEPDMTKFPLHGIATVKAVDSDGAIEANTYDMTWHLPLENMALVTFLPNVPRLVGSLTPIARNETIPTYLQIPGREGEIDWGDVGQKTGLPVAVAGAAGGAVLLIPEVASGPIGWVVATGQIVAAGASYQLGISSPDHPGTIQIQGNADYNEFCADVQHQVTTNTDPSHAGDLVRFIPPLLAAQALAMSQNLSAPPVYSGWSSDPYFMHSTAMWQGGWYTDVKDLLGDGYDTHGYTGYVPGHTEVPQTAFKYFVWTCTYFPPPTK